MSDDTPTPDEPPAKPSKGKMLAVLRTEASDRRKALFLDHYAAGLSIKDCCAQVGVIVPTYEKWRQRDDKFRAKADQIRLGLRHSKVRDPAKMTSAEFAAHFFGMKYADFQLRALYAVEATKLGDITMIQFPPEHGKTTLFENYTNEKLARDPDHRFIIASESTTISRKILARIRNRMEPMGPTPAYVSKFGPFVPQLGEGRHVSQPWGADYFNVYKKKSHDERDYSVAALGAGSSIVSARCNHLHLDDIQSTKTLPLTNKFMDWFRMDAITRPGESGITTIFGTKVGDGDFYEELEDDEGLDGILHVIRMPAILTDIETGEQKPLWHERYTMDMMDRMARKVGGGPGGQERWDRAYMMKRSSDRKKRTFNDDAIQLALRPTLSVDDPIERRRPCFVALDPNIGGGRNVTMLCEIVPFEEKGKRTTKLRMHRYWDVTGLQNNSEVLAQVEMACVEAERHGAVVTDVIIETNAFQKGLMHDSELVALKKRYGFVARDHLTHWSKYDENVGVASMASSFIRGEIELPYAPDPKTRAQTDALIAQLKAWRPFVRGNRLRQDLVMTLWFCWILWQQRHKDTEVVEDTTDQWRRSALPYKPTASGLLVPSSVR